jgi:hypothetical protein
VKVKTEHHGEEKGRKEKEIELDRKTKKDSIIEKRMAKRRQK